MSKNHCPECGSLGTETVHAEWYMDMVEEMRICGDCPTEYTVTYVDPQVTDVRSYE